MALSKKATTQIEKAIARYKAFLKLRSIGPHAISKEEMKELIRSGFLKNMKSFNSPVIESYLLTHAQAVDGDPAPRSVRDGAVDFLERMMDRYIGKAADQLKTDVLSTIEGTLMPIQDRREGAQIYEVLRDSQVHKKDLRTALKDKVDNWEYRWRTIVNTELNRASNWGSMDAILHNNPTKDPGEIRVYKQGNRPGHGSCEYCAKFWYMPDGVTPKTYTMAELLSNGSNIGKKAKDWLPTIDSTHPNESHILHELKPGFGFDVGGSVQFIGLDHDELKKQRGT